MEFHGLLHGIDKVLFTLGIESSDIVPSRVQLFNVFLHFRFVGFTAQADQLLSDLTALFNFGFGLFDLAIDVMQSDLLLLNLGWFDGWRLLTDQSFLEILECSHYSL